MVTAVIAGECLAQDDRGHLPGPQATPSQLGQTGAFADQRADATDHTHPVGRVGQA